MRKTFVVISKKKKIFYRVSRYRTYRESKTDRRKPILTGGISLQQ